jgi:hypothetical protein
MNASRERAAERLSFHCVEDCSERGGRGWRREDKRGERVVGALTLHYDRFVDIISITLPLKTFRSLPCVFRCAVIVG